MLRNYELIQDKEQVCISTKSILSAWRIKILLRFKYRFSRSGESVGFISDDKILKGFVRNDILIECGIDSFDGIYWLATNPKSRKFLSEFYNAHCSGS